MTLAIFKRSAVIFLPLTVFLVQAYNNGMMFRNGCRVQSGQVPLVSSVFFQNFQNLAPNVTVEVAHIISDLPFLPEF